MAKILIIKLGALGDVVMATSLIKHIQTHHYNDDVWLLTTPSFHGIFEHWNKLNITTFKRNGIVNFLKTVRWIRQNRFHRVYDLQSNDRTTILCALSGAGEIAGNHPRYPYTLHPAEKYIGQCHIFDRMQEILYSAGINRKPESPSLPVTEYDREFVARWLQDHQLTQKKYVVLHAGASERHPEKCWPGFSGLAVELEKTGYAVVWTGDAAEKKINAMLSQKSGLDATGVFSIIQLAELGRYACFALTNDSGPMHVFSASGIPVYGFFGPTDWRRNHAIGQKDRVITCNTGDEFIPCSLNTISPDMVVSRLRADGLI